DGRLARLLWIAIIVASELTCLPQGFGAPAIEGMRRMAVPLLVAATLAAAAGILLARRRRALLGAAVAWPLFALLLAEPLFRIRGELRYPIFAAHAAPEPAYQMHT